MSEFSELSHKIADAFVRLGPLGEESIASEDDGGGGVLVFAPLVQDWTPYTEHIEHIFPA